MLLVTVTIIQRSIAVILNILTKYQISQSLCISNIHVVVLIDFNKFFVYYDSLFIHYLERTGFSTFSNFFASFIILTISWVRFLWFLFFLWLLLFWWFGLLLFSITACAFCKKKCGL